VLYALAAIGYRAARLAHLIAETMARWPCSSWSGWPAFPGGSFSRRPC